MDTIRGVEDLPPPGWIAAFAFHVDVCGIGDALQHPVPTLVALRAWRVHGHYPLQAIATLNTLVIVDRHLSLDSYFVYHQLGFKLNYSGFQFIDSL